MAIYLEVLIQLRGGFLREKRWGCVWHAFKTTISDFPYPIYDMTKNPIPYLRLDPLNQYPVSE